MKEACCVAVRLRPLLKGETVTEDRLVLNDKNVRFHSNRQGLEKIFAVDHAFIPDETQVTIKTPIFCCLWNASLKEHRFAFVGGCLRPCCCPSHSHSAARCPQHSIRVWPNRKRENFYNARASSLLRECAHHQVTPLRIRTSHERRPVCHVNCSERGFMQPLAPCTYAILISVQVPASEA